MRAKAALTLLLLLAALAGCASPPHPAGLDEVSSQRLDDRIMVHAHDFAELNLQMREGDRIAFDWRVDEGTPVRFDVHSHAGREVVEHVKHAGAEFAADFTAPSAGTYSLMWINDAEAAVHVNATVEGRFTRNAS